MLRMDCLFVLLLVQSKTTIARKKMETKLRLTPSATANLLELDFPKDAGAVRRKLFERNKIDINL